MKSIVFWGTYDTGMAHSRMLLAGARAAGLAVNSCSVHVWKDIRDKATASRWRLLKALAAAFCSYPLLIGRFLRMPRPDAVVVGYPALLDALMLWPFARWRGIPVCIDLFVPIYEAVVEDRRLLAAASLPARLLRAGESLVCRLATVAFTDTQAHADYLEQQSRLTPGSIRRVLVGAESAYFQPAPAARQERRRRPLNVLFYGQFIPLHGIDTIVGAAGILFHAREDIQFTLAGEGQEAARIDALVECLRLSNIRRIGWIPYEELSRWIQTADICLGIFGDSGKAARVIPNKVYQVLACQRPLITRDSPAIRELLQPGERIRLIRPADASVLAHAILDLREMLAQGGESTPSPAIHEEIVGAQLACVCNEGVLRHARGRPA